MRNHLRRLMLVGIALAVIAAGALAAPALTAQTNRDGGVTVTVTPKNLAPGAASWDFDVKLETHTQSLDQDLMRAAVLVDAQGQTQAPIAWEGDPPGGHHRQGVLRFRPLAGSPAAVELRIFDLGGIKTRSFRWQRE